MTNMKFLTVCKQDESSLALEANVLKKLKERGYIYSKSNPDIVISIGGDGTFLRTVQDFFSINPLFVTINKGNLGYLCEFEDDEFDSVLENLDNPLIKEISLLNGKIDTMSIYALNEIRIESVKGNSIKFDISINDIFLETVRSDGCVVSSSIGSSGIARSLGGSLVDNEIEMLELIEKSPIQNRRYRSIETPFVLAKDKKITISSISEPFALVYDCKYQEIEDNSKEIIITLSNKKIRVLKNKHSNYITKTRRALLG